MKRILSMVLALILCLTLMAGCADSTPGSKESESSGNGTARKIAVGFRTGIDMAAAKALFKQIEEAYNVEFVYSEVMDNIEKELSFIDNCASVGCEAYITWCLNNIPQVASVCADNKMYYVVHSQWDNNWDGNNSYWAGTCGFANPPKGEMYRKMLAEFLKGDEETGILVTSGVACNGNPQHIETTVATLEAIQNHYGLKFSGSELMDLACVNAGTKLENDKNVNVYVLPGVPTQDGYNTQLSTLLSSGEYTILAGYGVDANLINIVTEAEEVIKKDIVVGGIAVISDALISIFDSQDQFGNCPVNYVALQYSSVTQAAMFALAYNAMTGYGDIFRDANGNATGYGCGQVTISDPSKGADYALLDNGTNPDSLVATIEWIDTLLADHNDNFTLDDWITNFVNVDGNALADAAMDRIQK